MKGNKIRVSEIFSSIQGEGATTGLPSIFLRVTGCNLLCGNPDPQGLKDKKQEDIEKGDNAEWLCDSIEVWTQGDEYNTKKLGKKLYDDYKQEFLNGAQIVLTGGEPLLQQDQYPALLESLRRELTIKPRVEVETNGTVVPETPQIIDNYNLSPKLSNSGMPGSRRINEAAMKKFSDLGWQDNATFKFVVTKEEDVEEIINDYVDPFELPKKHVWLMPGCGNIEKFEKTGPMVAELCKEHGFQFSSRLQINLWNEVTGV